MRGVVLARVVEIYPRDVLDRVREQVFFRIMGGRTRHRDDCTQSTMRLLAQAAQLINLRSLEFELAATLL